MYNEYFYTSAREVPNPIAPGVKGKLKPVTSRLRKSKNFWKLDRSLDDYIDRTKLVRPGPKSLLRKMLNLRSNEDSNEVKVTVNGLSKFLSVNVKTIRDWLKRLENAGFICYQGQDLDPHRNYPKKIYIFPVTFPGFDASTVFIQKGAKAKFKRREAGVTPEPRKQRLFKRAKDKRPRLARFALNTTCPVSEDLRDCPPLINQRETQTSREDTNVSSRRSLVSETCSATPTHVTERSASKRIMIMDLMPDVKSLLIAYLRENGNKGKINWVSNFIEQEVNANATIQTAEDVDSFMRDLEIVIPLFVANHHRGKKSLSLLFHFLRDYIAEYVGDSSVGSEWFERFRWLGVYREFNARNKFFREFPFCREPDDWYTPFPATGVNRY
jgi:hypothetical protein